MYDTAVYAYDNAVNTLGAACDYRARYYDPTIGRFPSEDPAHFNGGGTNFYRYVNNNPLIFIDPSGLMVEVVCVPVEQKFLGYFGARHCAIHVKYDDVDTMLERLGPTTLNREDWNGRQGVRPKLRRPQGDKCKDFEKCIIKKFQYYQGHIPDMAEYKPIDSNSNAFVLEVIRSCGGDLEFPSGFTFSDGYNFFGQMPDK